MCERKDEVRYFSGRQGDERALVLKDDPGEGREEQPIQIATKDVISCTVYYPTSTRELYCSQQEPRDKEEILAKRRQQKTTYERTGGVQNAVKMSDPKRSDSFRSEIKKQKRRLSATKLPSKPEVEPTPTPADLVDLRMVARVGKDKRSGSCGEIRPMR